MKTNENFIAVAQAYCDAGHTLSRTWIMRTFKVTSKMAQLIYDQVDGREVSFDRFRIY